MVSYVRALLDGSAPGMDALTPRWDILQGAQRIGYAWQAQLYEGHAITFKNGLTGGFTSKIVLDRRSQRAVIVLSNTAAQVDDAANGLLVADQAAAEESFAAELTNLGCSTSAVSAWHRSPTFDTARPKLHERVA